MPVIYILYLRPDRRSARRLKRALNAITIPKPLRKEYGIAWTRPLLNVQILPSEGNQVPSDGVVVALLSSRSMRSEAFDSAVHNCLEDGSPLVPVYVEAQSSGDVAELAGSLLKGRDILAIDLDKRADGWRDGPLKVAARILGIPFNALRDREIRRERARIRFNIFATLGLITIALSAALLTWGAVMGLKAALESTAAVFFLNQSTISELSRYTVVPGPTAPAAIDAMYKHMGRVEGFASSLPFHPAVFLLGPSIAVDERATIATALLRRGQFDEAVALLEEARTITQSPEFSQAAQIGLGGHLDSSAAQYEVETLLARTYEIAGEFERALALYLAIADEERKGSNRTPQDAASCARLAEALSHAALARALVSVQQGVPFWPPTELDEAHACAASIMDGPATEALPSLSGLAGSPENHRELKLALQATIEWSAFMVAQRTNRPDLIARHRSTAQAAVRTLESVVSDRAAPARRAFAEGSVLSLEELTTLIAKDRRRATRFAYDARNLTTLASRLEAASRLQTSEGDPQCLYSSDEAESILRALVDLDAGNLSFQAGLARALASRVDCASRVEQCALARTAQEESIRIYRALIKAQQLNARWRQELQLIEAEEPCKKTP